MAVTLTPVGETLVNVDCDSCNRTLLASWEDGTEVPGELPAVFAFAEAHDMMCDLSPQRQLPDRVLFVPRQRTAVD